MIETASPTQSIPIAFTLTEQAKLLEITPYGLRPSPPSSRQNLAFELAKLADARLVCEGCYPWWIGLSVPSVPASFRNVANARNRFIGLLRGKCRKMTGGDLVFHTVIEQNPGSDDDRNHVHTLAVPTKPGFHITKALAQELWRRSLQIPKDGPAPEVFIAECKTETDILTRRLYLFMDKNDEGAAGQFAPQHPAGPSAGLTRTDHTALYPAGPRNGTLTARGTRSPGSMPNAATGAAATGTPSAQDLCGLRSALTPGMAAPGTDYAKGSSVAYEAAHVMPIDVQATGSPDAAIDGAVSVAKGGQIATISRRPARKPPRWNVSGCHNSHCAVQAEQNVYRVWLSRESYNQIRQRFFGHIWNMDRLMVLRGWFDVGKHGYTARQVVQSIQALARKDAVQYGWNIPLLVEEIPNAPGPIAPPPSPAVIDEEVLLRHYTPEQQVQLRSIFALNRNLAAEQAAAEALRLAELDQMDEELRREDEEERLAWENDPPSCDWLDEAQQEDLWDGDGSVEDESEDYDEYPDEDPGENCADPEEPLDARNALEPNADPVGPELIESRDSLPLLRGARSRYVTSAIIWDAGPATNSSGHKDEVRQPAPKS